MYRSLVPYAVVDLIARRLTEQAEELLRGVKDSPVRAPDRRTLDQLTKVAGMPSAVLQRGLQALGWIVDERGLAGAAETNGLAWALPMHQLFERWVEHVTRAWAHATLTGGGRVVHLALVGLPMQVPLGQSMATLLRAWKAVRRQAA